MAAISRRSIRRWELTLRGAAICLALAVALSRPTPVRAEPHGESASGTGSEIAAAAKAEVEPEGLPPAAEKLCHALTQAASDNQLPEEFFIRLIWQESRFDPTAISPAGAQGIAQFMPHTAATRGLVNAFEPLQALRESASYLRELRTRFRGNLGLAAAAYNAGPDQVEEWLAGRRALPAETQAYVRIVTGYTAEAWALQPLQVTSSNTPTSVTCAKVAKLMSEGPRARLAAPPNPAWGPWGVQLASSWSVRGVLAAYDWKRRKYSTVLADRLPLVLYGRLDGRFFFVVRVSESSRTDAIALCRKLRAAGSPCVVLPNPRS